MNKPLPELIDHLDKSNRWKHDANDNAEAIDQAVEILKTMNWQPIETAPKDGSEILAAVRYPNKGRYESIFICWITTLKDYPDGVWGSDYEWPIICGTPTYWMPVPRYVPPATEL